jgi:hypothetical protein
MLSMVPDLKKPRGDSTRFPPLVGRWLLKMVEEHHSDGTIIRWPPPYSTETLGELIYDAGGRVSMQIARHRVPNFRSDRWADAAETASVSEMAAAYHGYSAYFGTYEVHERDGYLVHHVECALFPNLVGTHQRRRFQITENVLTLEPPAVEIASDQVARRLIWQRATRLLSDKPTPP